MSNAAINPAATDHPPGEDHGAGHGAHAHDPHLAHHFDTPEQQYASAKLGMWIFLGTEILMFGGLFCAYAVYRHNHPDVFAYAHHQLDKWLGAINTLVLITSSLTMAWAVRSAQLGHSTSLRWLMALTILGGYVFLGIKSVEYHTKWHHVLFIGSHNEFRPDYKGKKEIGGEELKERGTEAAQPPAAMPAANPSTQPEAHGVAAAAHAASPAIMSDSVSFAPLDPRRTTPADAATLQPHFPGEKLQELAPPAAESAKHDEEIKYSDLGKADLERLYTFFAVYFVMTGLHGLHVVIGMSLIVWVLLRSLGPKNNAWAIPLIPASVGVFLAVVGLIIKEEAGTVLIVSGLIIAVLSIIWALIWVPRRRNRSGESEFGPTYFTPVDLVGLYWHLVDLIWIFLFPLLYLIH